MLSTGFRLLRVILHGFLFLLLASCAHDQSPKVDFNRLDQARIDIPEKNALMLAAEAGSASRVKQAFADGDLLNAVSPEGTAFSLAIKAGHFTIAQFLLNAGADWQPGFAEGESSALMIVAEAGQNDLMKDLLIRKVPINYVDQEGHSALSKAANKGHLTTMKVLLAAGADANVMPEGKSVLMHVVEANNMLLSQMLIEAGADVNLRSDGGDTALRIARRKGFFDLDLMLVQAGAKP